MMFPFLLILINNLIKIVKKQMKYAHSRCVSPFNFLPFQLRPFVCEFEIYPPSHLPTYLSQWRPSTVFRAQRRGKTIRSKDELA